jgi:hypothetical protein
MWLALRGENMMIFGTLRGIVAAALEDRRNSLRCGLVPVALLRE